MALPFLFSGPGRLLPQWWHDSFSYFMRCSVQVPLIREAFHDHSNLSTSPTQADPELDLCPSFFVKQTDRFKKNTVNSEYQRTDNFLVKVCNLSVVIWYSDLTQWAQFDLATVFMTIQHLLIYFIGGLFLREHGHICFLGLLGQIPSNLLLWHNRNVPSHSGGVWKSELKMSAEQRSVRGL